MLGTAAAVTLVLLAVSGRYGYHRDELYFRVAGQHLAWGYVDQPPLTPAVARVSTALFGEHLWALRILPAIVAGAVVMMAAAFVRTLGGDDRAQLLAALTMAGTGFLLGVSHLLATAAFDFAVWTALLLVAARLLRTDDPRWWIAFGALAGVGLLNKNLVVLLAVALVAGLVIERRWSLLRSPWLLGGGALAAVIALPNLIWQAQHDWPQFEMAQAIEERIGGENRALLLPGQFALTGPLTAVLLVVGASTLLRDPRFRPYRALLWAWLAALVLTFLSGGRPYYPLPIAVALALVAVAAGHPRTRRSLTVLGGVTAVALLAALPLLPIDSVADFPLAELNETTAESIGWEDMVDTVAAAADDLPASERDRVILLALTYGEAGALELYGPSRGLPLPYSGHNSYADFRRPSDDDAPVLAIRYEAEWLAPYFERCDEITRFDNAHDVDNEVRGTPLLLCRGLRGSWDDVWDRLRRYS